MIAYDLDGTLLTTHDAYWEGISDKEANEIRMKQQLKYSPRHKFIIVTARSFRVADVTLQQLVRHGLDKKCRKVEMVGYDGDVAEKKIAACLKHGVKLLVEDNQNTIDRINADGRIKAVHIDSFLQKKAK